MLTQDKLPVQFQAVKDSDEEFLWVGEPLFIPFLVRGIPFLLFGLLWGAFDYFGFIRNMGREMAGFTIPFFMIHLFPFYGGILNIVRLVLVHKNTFYAITNKRVMMRSGFWGIDFKAIDYDKISDVEVNVNPVENFYKVGTIQFYSGRTNEKGNPITDNFIAVQEPYEVFRKVKTVSVDIKTDWNYPNQLRPEQNPGYKTKYKQP